MLDEIKFYTVTFFYGAIVIAGTLVLAYAGFSEAILLALK